jgi:hypothetical protein
MLMAIRFRKKFGRDQKIKRIPAETSPAAS